MIRRPRAISLELEERKLKPLLTFLEYMGNCLGSDAAERIYPGASEPYVKLASKL